MTAPVPAAMSSGSLSFGVRAQDLSRALTVVLARHLAVAEVIVAPDDDATAGAGGVRVMVWTDPSVERVEQFARTDPAAGIVVVSTDRAAREAAQVVDAGADRHLQAPTPAVVAAHVPAWPGVSSRKVPARLPRPQPRRATLSWWWLPPGRAPRPVRFLLRRRPGRSLPASTWRLLRDG